MERELVCPVCGKVFRSRWGAQRFCSAGCRRYSYRKNGISHEESAGGTESIRTFYCARCGKKVDVTDIRDRRTRFCCSHCERMYWKHSRKDKKKTDQNQA